MQVDDFVRWTGSDEEGEFSHVGQVYYIKNEMVALRTQHGVIHVPAEDGAFKVVDKPKDWNLSVVKTKRPTTASPNLPKTRKGQKRKKNGPTKIDLIVELLRKDPPSSRKDAIEKIVAAGISTPAGASTFYNTAKKLLKDD